MPEGENRKFQINPGPLRVVRAKQLPADEADPRCAARTMGGDGPRCFRYGKREVDGRWLCEQHARLAAVTRTTEETPDV